MPLAALRLINPPGHRRRKPFPTYAGGSTAKPNAGRSATPLKRAASYTKAETTAIKRHLAALKGARTKKLAARKAVKAKSNPGGSIVRKKKPAVRRRRTATGRFASAKRPAASRRRRTRRNPLLLPEHTATSVAAGKKAKRTAAAKKAAATRAAKKLMASERAKKAAATRRKNKEQGIVAKRKPVKARTSSPKKRKPAAKKRGKMTKAQRSAAARKGWRKRNAKKAAPKAAAPKRRRAKPRVVKTVRLRTRAQNRKRRKYAIQRRTKRGGMYQYRLRRAKKNPLTSLMQAFSTAGAAYLGFVAMRTANVQLAAQLANVSSLKSYSGYIAPAATLLLATVVAPKLMPGNAKLISALQYGAVFAFGDAILKAAIGDSTQKIGSQTLPKFLGLSDYSGVGEYIPLQEYTSEPLQLGANVEEAMALDEYVEGMGTEVEEALASPGLSDNEIQGFQSGYAGGVLARTVFSS